VMDLMPNQPEIANAASYLAPLSEIDRASKYPYNAPSSSYVLSHGALLGLDQATLDADGGGLLAGRVPVLSVGSNRAPVQLLRKFGSSAVVPVTPARLHDCDIVHTAYIGYYAAVPCTAFPMIGTVVDLNVAWLDPEQLMQMHRTEGIGVAYDFVEMQTVEHQMNVPKTSIFGYAARFGVLDCGERQPGALAAIKARGRRLETLDQAQAVTLVRELSGVNDCRSMSKFISDMQRDKNARDGVVERLRSHAIHPQNPPWTVVPVVVGNIEDYL
jgi:hypothetical protein